MSSFQDFFYLFWSTPLKIWGFVLFGSMGALLGHLLWFVSRERLDRLLAEQEGLRDEIQNLKKKIAERDRLRRERRSGAGEGLPGFAGWKDLWTRTRKREEEEEAPPEEVDSPAIPPEVVEEAVKVEAPPEGPIPVDDEPAPAALPDQDDFTQLEGIDPAAAQRLRESGVTTFRQLAELETMTPQERDQFAESFGLGPISLERWRWAWSGAAEREPGTGAPAESPAPAPAMAGDVIPAPRAELDDLKRIRAIDVELEQALRREGIATYDQIARWSQSDIREISDKLDLGDLILMQRWVPQATELARRREEDTGPAAAAAPQPEQATPVPERRMARIDFAGEPGAYADASFGVLYRQKPELTDDLTAIFGIKPLLEERLNRNGVYRYKQIAGWTDDQIRRVAQRLGLEEESIRREDWVGQARRLHEELYAPETIWDEAAPGEADLARRIREEFAGEPVRVDPGIGIVYHFRPPVVDDLKQIRGIGPVIEQQLNDGGIYRFKQIAAWAESHVRGVARLLNCFPDRIWRDRWIPQAHERSQPAETTEAVTRSAPQDVQETAGETELPSPAGAETQAVPPKPGPVAPESVDSFAILREWFAGESRVRVDPALGIVYGAQPPFRDDLTRIQGIDPALQGKLHELGIFRFKQITSWSDAQAGAVAQRLGIEKSRIREERWIPQAEDLLAKLHQLPSGWEQDRPSRADYERRIQEQFAREPVRADEQLGIVYTNPPSQMDDLSVIEGIDESLARRLHASGVYRFRQIANWSAANIEAFSRRLGFPRDAPYYEDWVQQASGHLSPETEPPESFAPAAEFAAEKGEPGESRAERFARDTGAGYNEQFGFLYPEPPRKRDDLKLIRGVDARLERILQHQGIYRFWQIEAWTDEQRATFAQRLGLGEAIEQQRWRERCRRLSVLSEAQEHPRYQAPAEVDQFAAIVEEFAGEPGIRVDPEFGIVFDEKPPVQDQLTLIRGLEARHEQALRSLGIHRFKQIVHWTDANVAAVAARLEIPKEAVENGKWIPQAIHLERGIYAAAPRWTTDRPVLVDYEKLMAEAFPGEPARADEDLGVIFTGRPGRVDELRRLSGVDEELERRLHACGVSTFRQIANWSAANVTAFAALLNVPPARIYQERWIPQAAAAQNRPRPAETQETASVPEERVDPFAVYREHFDGEPGARVDRRLGIVYDEPPAERDDLTRIQGLERQHDEVLGKLGIHRWKQIAHWSPSITREIARRLNVSPEQLHAAQWPAQAEKLHAEVYQASPAWTESRPSLEDYQARIEAQFSGEPVFADEELGILYRGRLGRVDRLSAIEGLSDEAERQLHAVGVYRFWQIAHWSRANVAGFERFLGLTPDSIYRRRWIPQAASLAQQRQPEEAEPGAVAAAEREEELDLVEVLEKLFAGEPGARVDRRFGLVYGHPPEVKDDLAMLRGVSPEWQTRLNEVGIYRFKQVAHWPPRVVREVAGYLGIEPERIQEQDWAGQARHLHEDIYSASPIWTQARPEIADYEREIAEDFAGEKVRADADLGIIYVGTPGRFDDLTRIQGVDETMARRLNALGVYRFKQIARWSGANVDAFARWLGCPPDRIYRDRWIGQSAALSREEPEAEEAPQAEKVPFVHYADDPNVLWDDELGCVYAREPETLDDLKLIRGIDESLERRLGELGIHRFWQLAMWSEERTRAVGRRLGFEERPLREEWVRQAHQLAILAEAEEADRFVAPEKVDQFAAIEEEFPGEFGLRADPTFGIVYHERPEVEDDLTQMEGLAPEQAERLRENGVYRFKQIAHWSDRNVAAFAGVAGLPKEELERRKWIPQACWLHWQTYQPGEAWTVDRPSVEELQECLDEHFAGERVQVDADYGILYVGRPSHVDDLTDIEGIDSVMARKLQASGVYCFRQLELWAGAHVRAFAERLEIPADRVYQERWIQQAEAVECQVPQPKRPREESEPEPVAPVPQDLAAEPSVERDERYGLVFRQRPEEVDRLRSIKGVGPKLERLLHEAGVYRFRQIANWGERQVEEFSRRFRIRDRIERERWVEQARELAELAEAEAGDLYLAPEKVDQIGILDAEFGHEPSVRVDPYLGIVFDEPPVVVDDLSLIDGVGKRLEEELNSLGVYRYNQIAAWSALNVAHFSRHLYCDQERIERDKWIPQARRLYRETYSASWGWGVSHPTLAEYQARIEEEFPLEAVRPDEALGIVYTGWPSHVDELSRLNGVTRDLERELNRLGIYTFEQVSNWSEANVEEVATRLGIAQQRIYRDRWIAQASDLMADPDRAQTGGPAGLDPHLVNVLAAEPGIQVDEQLGFLYPEPPRQPDALTSIRGIGKALALQLNNLGIYRYRQIASWSERTVRNLSERLRLGDRIARENWVQQAKELTALAEAEAGRSFVAPVTVDQDAVKEAAFRGEPSAEVDAHLGILLQRPPAVSDELTLISGIGPKLAEELNELGVYRFGQIASWNDHNVAEFAERLYCYKDRIERDKWVPQARRLHRETYAASPEWGIPRPSVRDYEELRAQIFPDVELAADPNLGLVHAVDPAERDDLTLIPGVTARHAEELNEAGIFTFRQVAYWSAANVEAIAQRLRIPPERIYRDRWIPAARELADAQPTEPAPVAKPGGPGGRRTEAEPGRRREDDAEEQRREELRRQEREARQRAERIRREREEWERAGEERRAREERARIERERREQEAKQRAEPIRREREAWERGQRREAGSAATSPPREQEIEPGPPEPGWERDERLGWVYRTRPEQPDDLTLIRGVGPKLERALHSYGVYEFRQIAEWTPPIAEEIGRRLGLRDEIEREGWIAQARELATLREQEEAEAFVAPETVDHSEVVAREFPEQEVRIDEELGIVYEAPPEVEDDLKLIRGVASKLERELNAYGVYRFKQIASWSDRNVTEFAHRLDCFKDRIERDKWILQARKLHRELYGASSEWGAFRPGIADLRSKIEEEFAGEDVVADADFGILYRTRPPVVDDLTEIRGLTPRHESELHAVGVYRFKQLANWSDANVEAFGELLECSPDHMYRHRWIPQGRELADAGRTAREEPPEREVTGSQEAFFHKHFAGEDVVLDDELGVLYEKTPARIDELKKIRGIGEKLAQSLNDYGVFQYRQIACWNRRNAEEFASRLNAFRDRIFRDNWMKQARVLHEEKYGESLDSGA